jgi:hypothetical protein
VLYYVATGFEGGSLNLPNVYLADLANFAIPTQIPVLTTGWTRAVALHFPGNISESGAYLGPPLLLIVALFAWRRWRTPAGRFLLACFALTVIGSLGAHLYIAGHRSVVLPWRVVAKVPVFDNVLPVRLTVYVWLVVSVIAALWLAAPGRAWPRIGLAALAILFLIPNIGEGYWKQQPPLPAFFSTRLLSACLPPDSNLIVVPYGDRGYSMFWQAETDFRFRMAEAYVGPEVPESFSSFPGFEAIYAGVPTGAAALEQFAAAKRVTAMVVVDDQTPEDLAWNTELPKYIHGRRAVGGVYIYPLALGYTVPAACRT